jgi:hypothetical protein
MTQFRTVALALLSLPLLGSTAISAAQTQTAPTTLNANSSNRFELKDFSKLIVEGHVDLTLVQGNENFVMIDSKAGVNPEAVFKIENIGDTLQLCSCQSWKFWRSESPKVTVSVRNLSELSLRGSGNLNAPSILKFANFKISMSGSGEVNFDQLESDFVKASLSGAGDMKLKGSAKSLQVSLAGAGDFAGEKFKADKVVVSMAGAGNVKVWANTEISMSMAGVGNIDYWGGAKVIKRSIAGMGSINAKGDR